MKLPQRGIECPLVFRLDAAGAPTARISVREAEETRYPSGAKDIAQAAKGHKGNTACRCEQRGILEQIRAIKDVVQAAALAF